MTETVSLAQIIVCKWNVMVIVFQLVTFLEQDHYHKILKLIFLLLFRKSIMSTQADFFSNSYIKK